MPKSLDIVVFGATGFSGRYTIPALVELAKSNTLSWGVAGRSESKLRDLLSTCEKQSGCSLSHVPLIIADIEKEETIKEMAREAQLIINCCGPFRFYGERLVKICIEEGTHHLDISGEVQYIEEMQLKYHKKAEEKGVYIISACGYESIPMDLGIVYMQQKFGGTLNSVEVYLKYWEEGGNVSGSAVNFGTWESAVYHLAHTREIQRVRRKLYSIPLPVFLPKLKMKMIPHKTNAIEGWGFPLDATDRAVIERSQYYFYERQSKRPVQVATYVNVGTFKNLLVMSTVGLLLQLLSKCSFGRKLLLKYPGTFSAGYVTRDPPNEERVKNAHFSITLLGKGWKQRFHDANYNYTAPPNTTIGLRVKGSNPVYGATSTILVLAAGTILTERGNMPPMGGVYPPGYAFANTTLVERLKQNGISFEILPEVTIDVSSL